MATATMTNPHDNIILQQALQSRVLLLSPTLGFWRGQYMLPRKKTTVTADGTTADEADVTVPRAILFTDAYPLDSKGKPWKKRFSSIENAKNAILDQLSVKFQIRGVCIVPKSQGAALMDQLYGLSLGQLRRKHAGLCANGQNGTAEYVQRQIDAVIAVEGPGVSNHTPVFDPRKSDAADPENISGQSIAYQLHVASREFCNNWDTIRAEIARKNTMFDQVADKVPKRGSDLLCKFFLDIVPIELAGTIDSNQLTDEDLQEHNLLIRNAVERRTEEAVMSMIEGPRQQLAEALAGLTSLIQRNGKVKSNSFNGVRKAIAKIRLFDCVANDDLLNTIKQLEHRLDITTAHELDQVTAANNGFTTAMNTFMAEVQDEVKAEQDLRQFGRECRAIDLD